MSLVDRLALGDAQEAVLGSTAAARQPCRQGTQLSCCAVCRRMGLARHAPWPTRGSKAAPCFRFTAAKRLTARLAYAATHLDPLEDLGQPLVLLALVVALAEVDQVHHRLGGQELQGWMGLIEGSGSVQCCKAVRCCTAFTAIDLVTTGLVHERSSLTLTVLSQLTSCCVQSPNRMSLPSCSSIRNGRPGWLIYHVPSNDGS